MKVGELINILKTMPEDSLVNVYAGYDPEYGDNYIDDFQAHLESTGWNNEKGEQIFEVFLR